MSTKYEYYTTGYDNAGDIRGAIWQGQSFTPAAGHTLTSVKFYLKRYGSPSGNLVVELKATDAKGKPTGSVLATGSIVASTVSTTTRAYMEITFDTEVTLTASTKYVIYMKLTAGDTSNYIGFGMDNTTPTYSDGTLVYTTNSGTSWTAESTQDTMFEVYGNPTTSIKTVVGLAKASVKTVNGLAIASVKTRNGLA